MFKLFHDNMNVLTSKIHLIRERLCLIDEWSLIILVYNSMLQLQFKFTFTGFKITSFN